MGTSQEVKELVGYLESDDVAVASQVKQVIQENLYSSKDPWFLNALFDHYLIRRSDQLLEVLTGINDHKAHQLFERMNEALKQGLHTEMCTLFAAIIRKQPSWLYKVIGTSFLMSFLKFLKNEEDVVLVMSGSLIISSLLPCVPSLIAPYLGEILVIFYKFSSLLVNQSVSIPDILLLHVQIGVYILFHRLYAMYPNTFVAFMKENFSGPKHADVVLNQVIRPMMNFVKFHPGLFTENVKSETDNAKWKLHQPHDIVAECQKFSLDPLDTVREATYSVYPQPSLSGESSNDLMSGGFTHAVTPGVLSTLDSVGMPKDMGASDSTGDRDSEDAEHSKGDAKPFLSNQALTTGFSPSELCGLSTPPHSRPQSPYESMDDSAPATDSASRAGLRSSLVDSSRDASSPVTNDQTPVSKGEKKSCDSEHLHFPLRSNSVETSPVFHRHGPGPKLDLSDSVARRHGRLLHMALTPSLPTELFDEWERAYHSMPATPTQVLARPKPLGRDDDLTHSGSRLSMGHPGDPKRISPLLHQETKKRISQHLGEMDNNKVGKSTPSSSGLTFDHPTEPSFTPIRASPLGSRDGSPQLEPHHNTPVALINVIQDLQRSMLPKAALESRRGSADACDSLTDSLKWKSRTPIEILDEFVECGASVHSMELSRIPLTSQLDTDWTYFGGNTPADESSILKTQLKLLQLQLQYERHKCDLHVLRNRRLVGKVHKAQEVADEVSVLKSKIELLESDQNEAKVSLRVREEENRSLKSFIENSEHHYSVIIRDMQEEKQRLTYEKTELANKNEELENRLSDFDEQLRNKSLNVLESENEIKSLKTQLLTNSDVKLKADNLAKELLTQQDRFELLREKFKALSIYCNQTDESELLIESTKNENSALHDENQTLSRALDAAKVRIQELEVALGKKEIVIRDHKSNIESLRQQHCCEIKALESKYQSLSKACRSLEAHVMYLYAKSEESGRQMQHTPTSSGYSVPSTDDRTRSRALCYPPSMSTSSRLSRELPETLSVGPETLDMLSSESGRSSVVDSGIVTFES